MRAPNLLLAPDAIYSNVVMPLIALMGAIWWGTRGTCPPTFLNGGDIICHVPQLFFSWGWYFVRLQN